MATTPVKVKSPFHNFNIPPTFFKWSCKTRCRRSPSTPERLLPEEEVEERETGKAAELESEPTEVEGGKPWKLRPRRAPAYSSSTAAKVTSAEAGENLPKSMRLREGGERRENRRFWIALSKDEIEEDIYALTGSKPSRRPRRRPRNVQKQLDNVFPGLWLVGFSPESYRSLDMMFLPIG